MIKNVTLNQYIAELQKIAEEHGEREIFSIGSSCGKINGLSSPHCLRLGGLDETIYVAAYQHDIKE